MHHLYPLGKGDPLCPLGFHPQVRWPTRCKRCFRDYKEHGGRKKDEDGNVTSSTPSLSTWNSPSSRGSDDDGSPKGSSKGWASSQNLNQETKKEKTDTFSSGFGRNSASWTSTPNLGGISDEMKTVTVSLTLPRRKPTPIDTGQPPENVVTMRRPSASPPPPPPAHLTINKNDSLAERVRKMQALKAHSNSLEKESSQEREKTPVKKDKPRDKSKPEEKKEISRESSDVKFLMQVKNARTKPTKPPIKGGPRRDETDKNEHSDLDDDTSSTTGTTTTEGTLVDEHTREYKEQIESLKDELDTMKKRCEKAEKEKSDILLRRLANLDTSSGKFTGRSSEVLKLQKKVNELTTLNEDLRDDKKSLSLKVKEVEAELEARPSAELAARQVEQMRSKLLAAETLCEELMDENEDMKKELRGMEEEIEEMQDNFREDQADEYSSLRRELEQTTKNCRVLSFKLKKTERRAEQLEQEKADQEKKLIEIVGGQSGMDRVAKIKELEQELGRSNEVALRLQKELQDANAKLAIQPPANQKRAPMLGSITKAASTDGKPSRSSLTRGGSQEDPQQLLRDLQDSLEREADLREQLKNAEEEAINLRKKASRVEDDNESLLLQLKKMATKARTRKLSPTAPVNRLPVEPNIEKDEGISDEEDPAELRILLELNEQEAAVLRRKVEELEQESDSLKRQLKELTDKLALGNMKAPTVITKKGATKNNALTEEKNKVLESEIADLRKKIIEKERDCERLHAELSLTQKRPKGSLTKSKSLDGNGNDQFSLDLKRQLQVIEQEASVLRTKTQSLEVDNEKLQAENKKLQLLSGAKTLRSEKSVENAEKMIQLETDLKEALSKVKELETFKAENEKSVKRVTFGGEQTKKDIDKIKLKQDEVDRLKLTLTKVETERDKISVSLKELKENALKSFKPRTAKKPTDFTTKLQLKKMVDDLENEIGELYIVMKNADINKLEAKQNETSALQKSLEELRSKLSKTESDMSNDKDRLQTEITQLKEKYSTAESEKKALSEKVKASETERDKALENWRVLSEEKKKQDVELNRLNVDLQNATTKQTAVADCMKKIEDLKKEGEQKEKQIEKMKKELELAAKLEQNKNKYVKEIGDKTKKIADLEKKLKESEDKFRQTDKMLTARKDRVAKLEKELSEEKEQTETLASSQRRMSSEWISEKESMHLKLHELECKLETVEEEWKDKLCESEGKVLTLESHIAAKIIHIQQLEAALRDVSNQKYDDAISPVELAQLQEKLDNSQRELALKERELTAAKQEISLKHVEFSKLQDDSAGSKQTILKLQHDLKDFENKLKVQTKDASHWESKASELEIDLMADRKKIERMKQSHEKDVKNKEIELATLKGKLRTLEQTSGAGSKKINELKDEYEEKMKKLEHELVIERQEYDELTGKYELLEEEHVVTKAKLTVEKETAQGQLVQLQRDHSNTTSQLKSLQDTYNSKTDAWIKEQIELQDKLSATEERLCGGGWEVEKARLIAKLDEKQKEVERMKQEREVKLHQQENLKKEHEELRKKLEDYDRLSKTQRNLASENNNLTRETKLLREKLDHVEKGKKMDINECKARYETQQQKMQEEMHSLQGQVSRFKRERDTFKTMLDNAQKNITELKASGDNTSIRSKRMSVTSIEELEESKSKLAALEQQINCLEDELCESRLLSSKLKTELISEKSTAEIKLSEMQSKINEFEEDRLLTSGRTGIPGMRTRMELAWQKERDEQQRLLQETSTLARDLRQTLFELERERDKERLDTKRRLEQLKRSTEEDADDNKKKVSELQCDLLELRDAHAKLRTTNEKLRRERERHERDKDNQRMSTAALKRQQQDDDKRIGFLLEQIEELIRQSPDLSNHLVTADISYLTPTPPRRNRSKSRSREATPESGISDNSVQSTLSRIQKAAEELKAARLAQKKQQILRNIGRAASSEPREDGVIVSTITPRLNGKAPPLSKRSLSLEQTNKDHPGIWKNDDDSVSSMQSLDAELDTRLFTMQRDTSLDSRLSGGSTQSDVQPGDKKKKKGFLGKLKQLTKSRSIDDAGPDMSDFKHIGSMSQGSDSDMSTNGSKRDLRGKLSDIFSRKSGQHSRSASKERKGAPNTPLPERAESSQRPLSRNGSSTQIPQMSNRSDSSTTSRSMSVTPGMQRKKK